MCLEAGPNPTRTPEKGPNPTLGRETHLRAGGSTLTVATGLAGLTLQGDRALWDGSDRGGT